MTVSLANPWAESEEQIAEHGRFEEWCATEDLDITRDALIPAVYESYLTQIAWNAWRAGKESK